MKMKNPAFNGIVMDGDAVLDYSNEGKRTGCTRLGVFGKTIFLIAIAFATAIVAISILNQIVNGDEDKIGLLAGLLVGSSVVTLVSALVCAFSISACPIFSILYAAGEGIALGTLSALVDLAYPGIAFVAIIATFIVTLTMGALYLLGFARYSRKLYAFCLTILISAIIISLIATICNAFGYSAVGNLFFGNGAIGWILSILLVLVASLSLVFDFDYAAEIINCNCDKKYEWRAAYALSVSVIYLYLRILELLIRIAGSKK